jgi:hypothetical protein
MISFCLFSISLFISFALSCNLPNVIYYSTNHKSGSLLYNENYYPIGNYNKIVNDYSNGYDYGYGYDYSNKNNLYTKPSYKYVLLFDVNAFHYYFSFYMMFLIYSLSTKILLILLKNNHIQYDMSKLLNSVIKKRTNVNMNDTYYIPDPDTLDGDRDGSDGDRDGSDGDRDGSDGDRDGSDGDRDGSEDGGERDEEQDKCIKEQEQEGDRSDEDGSDGEKSDEEKSDGSDGEGEGEEGCCECNNENCTYFSIDNECKIKCISCE